MASCAGGAVVADPGLPRLLRWKLSVYRRDLDPRIERKLIAEGARAELGLPLSRDESGAPLLARLRHRSAARLARSFHSVWRRSTARPPA